MELCKKVQVEEYVIHVVGSTNFYTHLRFSLLASTWFPRALGVCLWSALQMLLVLYETLMLLVLILIVFVLAVLTDALIVIVLIFFDLIFHIGVIVDFLVISIGVALAWLRLGLGHYLFTAGETLPPRPQDSQPACVMGRGPCPFLKEACKGSITLNFVLHLILVSFPYRRAQLGDLCREIVPWCDTIVI